MTLDEIRREFNRQTRCSSINASNRRGKVMCGERDAHKKVKEVHMAGAEKRAKCTKIIGGQGYWLFKRVNDMI